MDSYGIVRGSKCCYWQGDTYMNRRHFLGQDVDPNHPKLSFRDPQSKQELLDLLKNLKL